MGEAMLQSEPSSSTRVIKLKPLAKLPAQPVLQALSANDVKRLRRLLADHLEYVHDDYFARPEAPDLLSRPLYLWRVNRGSDDSGVYGLGETASAIGALERERFLFLRLNYCRKRVFELIQAWAGKRLPAEVVEDVLRWESEVAETRCEIVRENMPLVLAMAKRTRITGVDLTDLISEGNLALLRSVNKFDSSRGYRFSTYACRAILKSFSRVAARMARHRGHFPTEFDPALEKGNHVEETRTAAEGDCVHELRSILTDNVARLSEVEQRVILARFALDVPLGDAAQRAKTLEQVGDMIGVTKERVRQIQNKALLKLRQALEQAVLS
jgi:RNA polymerase sigma factor (sigma-70 family)